MESKIEKILKEGRRRINPKKETVESKKERGVAGYKKTGFKKKRVQ